MKRILQGLFVVLLLLAPAGLQAEKVANLPAPTNYVSDFAGVLSPSTLQNVDQICAELDRSAHAQIAVVTIKTLDDDQSIEEFTTQLEDKWKVGNKADRGVLMVLVMNPRRGRIEVGYGLEGILNDAKVGDIGRSMVPAAQQGDYNTVVPLGVNQLAQVIAADANVALSTSDGQQHYYHREPAQTVTLSPLQVLVIGGVILVIIIILISTGHIGLLFFLLANLMGGGGGGRGGGDGEGGGGGFGGFGGGSSGGGGASGDF